MIFPFRSPVATSHRGLARRVAAFVLLASVGLSAPVYAQPVPRGAPVIKTPPRGIPGQAPQVGPVAPGGTGTPGTRTPPTTGGRPQPGQPTQPPGTGPAAPPTDKDPMSGVAKEPDIAFKAPKPGTLFDFTMEEADLNELVKAISQITGRRFIYGGKLRAIKVNVVSPDKVTVGEAYSAFLAILESNGMTVIPHGRYMKIIETQGAATQTTPVFGTAAPVPGEDRYVTRLYRLSHVDATEVSTVLNKFKSKDGDIVVYPPGNLLIITDTGTNIQRMLRIVEEVDTGGAGDQLWVEPVHYASATDVATKLNEILDLKSGGTGKGGKGAAGGGRIIADERTNTLIIPATEVDYQRLLELINRMDIPQSGEGQIHVLPLQHAACKDLSTTLNQILGGSAGGGGGGRGAAAKAAAPAVPGSTEDIFEGQIRVTCDEATNSLVTTSSNRDYAALRAVIEKLDMPRRQVFIEAVIMDVNVDRSTDIGLGYHAGDTVDFGSGRQGVFYGGNNPGQSVLGVPANLEALALGLRGPEIEGSTNIFPGVTIPALGVVMHALAKDGNSNVLATPHILATDNIDAEISIGQNIPLQTNVGGGSSLAGLAGLAGGAGAAGAQGAAGLAGLLGGGGLGFGNAPRQDVGTKIKVKPHVNDSDQVRLELSEEISDAGSPTGALGAVPINKRTATTTLIVRDQQTVVIGGLVRDAVVNGETKIPILGDIPVLGVLFKQTQKKTTKTNLLLILTPYVVRDQDDLRAIFERKMQERQEFLDRYFVFNEGADWSPPRDYSRASGLLDVIRQMILAQEEKARLEEEARPKGPLTHEPGKPIALPSIGGAGRGGGTGTATQPARGQGGDDDGPATQGTTRPRLRIPERPNTNPMPNVPPPPRVDRVE